MHPSIRGRRPAALAAVLMIAVSAGAGVFALTPDDTARNDARIDINKATVEQFASIKGVGPVLAQRIVEFRDANGPFGSVDDLLKVKGIGEKLLDKVRDQLVAGRSRR